jgi:hypothetical protein
MSSTQDDVQQLVAAAHFLRDQPKAEAHYYSRVIAEVAQRMLAAPQASAQEPAGWRDFLVKLSATDGGVVNGNRLSLAAKELLAAHTTPVEARCKSCGGNDGDMPCAYPGEGKPGCLRDARRAAQPETWKVLPSPARVTGEILHQAFHDFPAEKWELPASRQAVWNRIAERVNVRMAVSTGELKQEAKD